MAIRTGLAARLIALSVVSFAASACAGNAATPPAFPPSTQPPVEPATAIPAANMTPVATLVSPTRTYTATSAMTLTLWATEDLSPGTTAAGRQLRNQFDAFTAANPYIHVDVILKKPYGKGGMLDFLTTSAVAPDQLPDLATLDISEVPQAAAAGILQPLDPLLTANVKGDLFPFAYQAALYQGKWVALPFTADIEHLVYSKTLVKRVPQTWDDLLRQRGSFLAPAGGDDAFLVQYLALAPLFDATNQVVVDTNAASQVLNFYKRAHDLGLLPDTAIGLKNSDEAWPVFGAGKVAMVQAWASRYLADRDKLPDAAYAAIPTRDGQPSAVAVGWSFVLVTTNAARQAAAARFIQWFVQAEHLAPWLRAAHRLPASRSALTLSVDPVDYTIFLRDPLEHAAYLPPSGVYGRASDAWRAAMAAVWKGQTTPEEAARNIAGALK